MTVGASQESFRASPAYLSALRAHWEGRPRTCIERLTSVLSSDRLSSDDVLMYRLWVEVLSQADEEESLVELYKHLGIFIAHGVSDLASYEAIRGLIQFELDQIEASELTLRGIKTNHRNPYVWELRYRLHRRKSIENPKTNFKSNRQALQDYFHLTLYAEAAVCTDDAVEFGWCESALRKHYPRAPYLFLVKFHQALDEREFRRAVEPAKQLTQEYPMNGEYGFNLGYVLSKLDRTDEAIKEFTRVNELYPGEDLDVLNWLGYSLAQKAIKTNNQKIRRQAEQCINKSLKLSTELGLPQDFARSVLAEIGEAFVDSKKEEGEFKVYGVKVDERLYHRLRTSNVAEINQIGVAFDCDANPGDLCFIFAEDHVRDGEGWRLAALYRIREEAYWDPFWGMKNNLSLVDRPEIAVPVERLGGFSVANQAFELESGDLDSINQSLEEFLGKAADSVYPTMRRVR